MKGAYLIDIHNISPSIEVVSNAHFENLGFDLRSPLPSTLTYANSLYFLRRGLDAEQITAIMTSRNIYENYMAKYDGAITKGLSISDNPVKDFFLFHNFLAKNSQIYDRDVQTRIGSNCTISKLASISTENVVIGDRVVIEDFVRINSNVTIGSDSVVCAGSIIGNDGFQFMQLTGTVLRVEHVGGVRIGRNVEIQSNCCVDRHIFNDDTTIGDDTKFDSFVHLAHGSKVGQRCRIAAHAMIAGSTIIGDDVWIGPSAAISSAITIGDRASITIGAVVIADVGIGQCVTGNFAIEHRKFLRYFKGLSGNSASGTCDTEN